jgi:hypothetical protein
MYRTIAVAVAATFMTAGAAFAGGYGGSHGGTSQFAYASAKNVAIQKAVGYKAINVTGAAGIAVNYSPKAKTQVAVASASNHSAQFAAGLYAINVSGSAAVALNINSGYGSNNNVPR